MALLDDFFRACDMHQLTYDTIPEARTAAEWYIKGSHVVKKICIVPEDEDAPDIGDFDVVIRARHMAPESWVIV